LTDGRQTRKKLGLLLLLLLQNPSHKNLLRLNPQLKLRMMMVLKKLLEGTPI
jgi:hypothetical protein